MKFIGFVMFINSLNSILLIVKLFFIFVKLIMSISTHVNYTYFDANCNKTQSDMFFPFVLKE